MDGHQHDQLVGLILLIILALAIILWLAIRIRNYKKKPMNIVLPDKPKTVKNVEKLIEGNINTSYEAEMTTSTKSENTNNNIFDLPPNINWENCSIIKGNFAFVCSKCNEENNLNVNQLSSKSTSTIKNIKGTGKEILWGREITGKVFAFVISCIVGGILASIVGGYPFWITVIAVLTFLGLKPILIDKFMNKLPVWTFKCKNCDKLTFIASDGKEAVFGKISAKRGQKR